jgi:UV DNA damage endonuclease
MPSANVPHTKGKKHRWYDMLVRFGFVAMSMSLEDASPSKAVTLKTYLKMVEDNNPEVALEKVCRTAEQNLANSLRLLHYAIANHVKLYRFSSKIIPLATHPELRDWDYIKDLQPQLDLMGAFIRDHEMRVSFHPDHFTLLNSPRENVFESSIVDLAHHCKLLNGMGLDSSAKLIIHVGGGYSNKAEALERFMENWSRVPIGIAKRLTLENDDKTFTPIDTLYLCEKLQLPMVLDLHHYRCNHEEDSSLEDILPRFISTWEETNLPPKLHISSPKCDTEIRSHHDYVNPEDLYPTLQLLKQHGTDIDVMVEAKQKDKAMFRLISKLGKMPGIEEIDTGSIKVH